MMSLLFQSNPFLPNPISYLLSLIGLVILFYMVGRVLLNRIVSIGENTDFSTSTISSIMVGITIVLPIFAILWTKGNSIMWIALCVWIGCLFFTRKTRKTPLNFKVEQLLPLFRFVALIILCFCASYWLFFVRSGGLIFADQIYYGNVAADILQNHIESSSFLPDNHAASMYHWGDIWMSVFPSYCLRLKPLYALCLITYPFFAALCIAALYCVSKRIIPNASRLESIALGITFLIFTPIASIIIGWNLVLAENPKNFLIAAFLLWGMLLWLSDQKRLAILSLLLVVPFYSVLAPGALTLAFVLSLYLEYEEKRSIKQINFISLLPSVLVGVFFLLFYMFQSSVNSGSGSGIVALYNGNMMYNIFSFFIKRSLYVPYVLAPITILSLLVKNIRVRCIAAKWEFICLYLSCVVAALVGGVVRQYNLDGGQIYTNFADIISLIISYFGFMALIGYVKAVCHYRFLIYVPLLFVVYGFIWHVRDGSKVYLKSDFDCQEIETFSSIVDMIDENEQFGYIRNYSLEENFNTQKTRIDMFFPLDKLVHVIPNGYYHPYCLSVLDRPMDIQSKWDDSEKSALYQYRERLIQEGEYESDEMCVLNFVKDYKIDYLVVEYGAELLSVLNGSKLVLRGRDGSALYRVNY